MKLRNVLKSLLLIFMSSGLSAQDFYSYKLFNNKFEAVFPSSPILTHEGEIKMYSYIEKKNNMVYTSRYLSYESIFKKDIIYYKKEDIDNMILNPLKESGQQITSFNSVKNIKTKEYSYSLTKKFKIGNSIIFQSTRGFIYKTELYSWSVQSLNPSQNEIIFNTYKQYCKVIK